MNAEQFLTAFNANVERIWPSGTGEQWTKGIYKVLMSIGESQDFITRCKGSKDGGELYNLDFIYFPKREGVEGKDNWASPAVVVEHENNYRFYDTAVDFWKLCHFVAPLRVMIGYQTTEDDADKVGQQLIDLYQDWDWRQAADAETLLIMGWYQKERPRNWHIWCLSGTKADFVRM